MASTRTPMQEVTTNYLPPLEPPTVSAFCTPNPTPNIDDIDDDDSRLDYNRWTCGQIRAKINLFMKTGEMKVGGQGAIRANSQILILPLLGIKKKKKAPGTTKKAKIDNEAKYDVSEISLEGEDKVTVQVYDTCDVVRKKIRAFMKESGMSQTAFCHKISETFPADMNKRLQGRSLTSFLAKSGPDQGNSSEIFYAAYVFFEKLRIRDGKPKTEFRESMEKIWKREGGFDRKLRSGWIFAFNNETPFLHVDEFGRQTVVRGRGRGR
ncbi:hypothetical protein BJX70DRAFT_396714 [Aspergillus crustosus]